jgi:adenine-specific DNA-methyltransferase
MSTRENDLVLDFFAGSGSTGHTVIKQNEIDGGSRRFVLVQLPEPAPEGSFAKENGFETIAEITKERIRRVINQMVDGQNLFNVNHSNIGGFRMFQLERSNFAVWDANAIEGDESKLEQQLFAQVEHVLPGRTNQDILFELMLKSRYDLTTPVERENVGKCEIWKVAGGEMIAVIDSGLTVDVVREIATMKPVSVVILDRCFAADDSLKSNARKILEDAKVDLKTV